MLLLEAYQKAYAYIFKWHDKWPYDHWYGIAPDWDLNMWIDAEGNPAATLYPVHNGSTDSTVFFGVPLPSGLWK